MDYLIVALIVVLIIRAIRNDKADKRPIGGGTRRDGGATRQK